MSETSNPSSVSSIIARVRARSQSSANSNSIVQDNGAIKQSKLEKWDMKLAQYPFLAKLESMTGIRRVYIALVFAALATLLVFRGVGVGVLCSCIGFLYPLHMSLCSIQRGSHSLHLLRELEAEEARCQEHSASLVEQDESFVDDVLKERESALKETRSWLIYWIVYGCFHLVESLSDSMLSWFPFYHPIKLIFLLWCFLPAYQGAQSVFNILIRPLLIRHQKDIEHSVDSVKQTAQYTANVVSRDVRAGSQHIAQFIRTTSLSVLQSSAPSLLTNEAHSELNSAAAAAAPSVPSPAN